MTRTTERSERDVLHGRQRLAEVYEAHLLFECGSRPRGLLRLLSVLVVRGYRDGDFW